MASSAKGQSERPTLVCVSKDQYGAVLLAAEAYDAYQRLKKAQDQTGIQEARMIKRYFERFAARGPEGLDGSRMFKPLGRLPVPGGKGVQVFEIKAYQWRVLGVLRTINGTRSFVGLCCDESKKKNKGNRDLMLKAAKLSAEF